MAASPCKANLSYSYLDVSFSCNVAQNLSFRYFPILFPLGIIWSIFFQQAQIMLSAAHDTAHNRLYSGFLQRCAGTDFWPQSNSGGSAPEDTTRSPPGFLVRQEVSRQKHRAANRSHGIRNPRKQCHIQTSPLAGTVHFQYSPKVYIVHHREYCWPNSI